MKADKVMDEMKESSGFDFIALEKDKLFDIAQFAAEYHEELKTSDPNMEPALRRSASIKAAAEKFEVEPDQIELSLEKHDSVNDPQMQPFLAKINDENIKEKLLPAFVTSLVR